MPQKIWPRLALVDGNGQPIFLGNRRPAALVAEVGSRLRTATGATARTTARRPVYR